MDLILPSVPKSGYSTCTFFKTKYFLLSIVLVSAVVGFLFNLASASSFAFLNLVPCAISVDSSSVSSGTFVSILSDKLEFHIINCFDF